ncbi:MAG: hypothetical protein ABL932_01890 [Terricaulis sp.]
MFKICTGAVVTTLMSVASAYATAAPAEEKEFPLAMVFALIAVACGVGTALFASSQSNKKKD